MKLRSLVRTLIPAALLALAVAGVSSTGASASPKQPGGGQVYCVLKGENVVGSEDDLNFYLPGDTEIVLLPDGRTELVRCGADGKWHPVRVAPLGGQQFVAPAGSIAP